MGLAVQYDPIPPLEFHLLGTNTIRATLRCRLILSAVLLCTAPNSWPDAVESRPAAMVRLAGLVDEVSADYPTVRHVSVQDFRSQYAGALLIDVREADEYAVSRLPGAHHAASPAAIDALAALHPDRPVVFYCTVGVRSAIAAGEFMQRQVVREAAAGAAHAEALPSIPVAESASAAGRIRIQREVVNLAGSIFAWANSGGALENDKGPTSAVHPYSAWWGMRYLDRSTVRARRSPE